MSKTRAKGNRARLELVKNFEAHGYDVAIVERTGRFIKIKDAFGLFDLCVWRGDEVAFVQVTCNRPHSHKSYKEFSKTHHNAHVLQFVKIDGGTWDAYSYDDGLQTKELQGVKLK